MLTISTISIHAYIGTSTMYNIAESFRINIIPLSQQLPRPRLIVVMDDDLSHHAGRPRPLSSLILPAELERFEHDRPDDGDDDRPQSPRVQASPAGYMPPRLSHLHPPLPQQQQQHPHSPLVCFGRALQKAALQGGITDSMPPLHLVAFVLHLSVWHCNRYYFSLTWLRRP